MGCKGKGFQNKSRRLFPWQQTRYNCTYSGPMQCVTANHCWIGVWGYGELILTKAARCWKHIPITFFDVTEVRRPKKAIPQANSQCNFPNGKRILDFFSGSNLRNMCFTNLCCNALAWEFNSESKTLWLRSFLVVFLGTEKGGHYDKKSFRHRESLIEALISPGCQEMVRSSSNSGDHLESLLDNISRLLRESLDMDLSEETTFPKDPFVWSRLLKTKQNLKSTFLVPSLYKGSIWEFPNLVVLNLVVCNFFAEALFCALFAPLRALLQTCVCALLRSFAQSPNPQIPVNSGNSFPLFSLGAWPWYASLLLDARISMRTNHACKLTISRTRNF